MSDGHGNQSRLTWIWCEQSQGSFLYDQSLGLICWDQSGCWIPYGNPSSYLNESGHPPSQRPRRSLYREHSSPGSTRYQSPDIDTGSGFPPLKGTSTHSHPIHHTPMTETPNSIWIDVSRGQKQESYTDDRRQEIAPPRTRHAETSNPRRTDVSRGETQEYYTDERRQDIARPRTRHTETPYPRRTDVSRGDTQEYYTDDRRQAIALRRTSHQKQPPAGSGAGTTRRFHRGHQ